MTTGGRGRRRVVSSKEFSVLRPLGRKRQKERIKSHCPRTKEKRSRFKKSGVSTRETVALAVRGEILQSARGPGSEKRRASKRRETEALLSKGSSPFAGKGGGRRLLKSGKWMGKKRCGTRGRVPLQRSKKFLKGGEDPQTGRKKGMGRKRDHRGTGSAINV